MNKIVIPLGNGYNLVAEQNTDSDFNKEIFIGINKGETYFQDLCIVRPTYIFKKNEVLFNDDEFEMLIFGDAGREDYTHKFTVPLYEDNEE